MIKIAFSTKELRRNTFVLISYAFNLSRSIAYVWLTQIDFGWIDSIISILTKYEFKVKWFLLEYIHLKVSRTLNLC